MNLSFSIRPPPKLYEWTNQRWIITLSQKTGEMSLKDVQKNKVKKNLDKAKNNKTYKKILETFPDAELISIEEES